MQEKIQTVRGVLAQQFGAKTIRIKDNVLKVNTPFMLGDCIGALNKLMADTHCGVVIKRSGTGLVIIVTLIHK